MQRTKYDKSKEGKKGYWAGAKKAALLGAALGGLGGAKLGAQALKGYAAPLVY